MVNKKRLAAITSAYTGYHIAEFSNTHAYIEEILGRPVWTHELASQELADLIHEKSKADFVSIWKEFLEEDNASS